MTDKRARDEDWAKAKLPFGMAALLVLLAYFSAGFWPAVLVIIAFFVGYLPVEKILFFVNGVEDRRARGRKALHPLADAEIERLLAIIRDGRKIEAVKELRAINNDGLRDALDAIELLQDFGLNWRDSQDRPLS